MQLVGEKISTYKCNWYILVWDNVHNIWELGHWDKDNILPQLNTGMNFKVAASIMINK